MLKLSRIYILAWALLLSFGHLKAEVEIERAAEEAPDGVKTDRWRFLVRDPVYLQYRRMPEAPFLPNADFGVGIGGGGGFSNWYPNNTIRVIINDQDVFSYTAAKSIEYVEGEEGKLRFTWEKDGDPNNKVILDWSISEEGKGIFARIDVSSFASASSIQVQITCYPGGFAPAEGMESQRVITTKDEEVQATDSTILPLTEGQSWLFYSDNIADKGSLGLLLNADERASGEIRMSRYQQTTILNYPTGSRVIHLGFFAFLTPNATAKENFLSIIEEQKTFSGIKFLEDKDL